MTGLQSILGAFCVMRGMRMLGADESAASMLRRLQQEDPVGYDCWWEENPNETWERIENDEEYEAEMMKEAGLEPPIRKKPTEEDCINGRPRRPQREPESCEVQAVWTNGASA